MMTKAYPPFYFPTQVILVDDNKKFLRHLSVALPKDMVYTPFFEPDVALNYIIQSEQESLSSCLMDDFENRRDLGTISRDFSFDHDILSSFFRRKKRFTEVSTVITDYSMPVINGIELCRGIENKFTKRVILTGVKAEEEAVRAFNDGAINSHLLKGEYDILEDVRNATLNYKNQYFLDMCEHINVYLGKTHFLNDTAFSKYFSSVIEEKNIVEYYMAYPGKLLCFDNKGKHYLLIVETHETLFYQTEVAKERKAPDDLILKLDTGSFVTFFETKDCYYNSKIDDWDQCLYDIETNIEGDDIYVCTLLESPKLHSINLEDIHSFDDFKDYHFDIWTSGGI